MRMTTKQKRFVLEYLADLNGAAAARRAGYSEASARQTAHELLNENEAVKTAIDEFLTKLAMPLSEAVYRMSRYARGSIDPFLTDAGELDMDTDEARANRYLIKKLKQKKETRTDESGTTEIVYTELDLHDAKDAVDKMILIHGGYKQATRIDLNNLTDAQLDEVFNKALDKVRTLNAHDTQSENTGH